MQKQSPCLVCLVTECENKKEGGKVLLCAHLSCRNMLRFELKVALIHLLKNSSTSNTSLSGWHRHTYTFSLCPSTHPPTCIISLSPSSLLPNLSFTHPNALCCIILVPGPSMAARCLFMDCTNDRNDRGEGEPVTHEMGKDYKAE